MVSDVAAWTRRRPISRTTAVAVFSGALLVVSAVVLWHLTRGTTLWFDEWQWALNRRGGDPGTYLRPHNEHLSLVPVAIYKLLFVTAGLEHYGPYRALVIAAHLACVALVFVYARRRVGDLAAAVAASLLLFLGPAWQTILWPFQIGYLISLGAGIGALLMLDRRDRAGDVAACGLLAISLASSGIGVPVAVLMVVDLLVGRRAPRDLWIVFAPLAVYALWWLTYEEIVWVKVAKAAGIEHPVTRALTHAPGFVADSAAATLAALVGLHGSVPADGSGPGSLLTLGRPLALIALGLATWRVVRLGAVPARVLALLAAALTFWFFTALNRGLISAPYTSRYLYVGAVFVLLLAVELAKGVVVSRTADVIMVCLGAAAIASNLSVLRAGAGFLRDQAGVTRVQTGVLDLSRPIVRPTFLANPISGLAAGPYFATETAVGSPGESPAAIAAEPEGPRFQADTDLVRIQGATARPQPEGLPVKAAPTPERVAGGTAERRGACILYRSDASAPPGARTLEIAVPRAGLLITAHGGPAALGVRRFATEFHAVATLASAAPSSVRLRPDLASEPWHVRLAPSRLATVCGLR